ncbi:MAG: ATP-dependent sacrificial sulfur transferase LarE [Thermodesulfatator sp.]|nr:MAG: ATP-dependent sacrificial sulfur transferase LarE [Thermodesulfatator sp.]
MIPEALRQALLTPRRVAVAFSGGMDSAVLLACAARVLGPERVIALHAVGEVFPPRERIWARETARQLGIRLEEIPVDLLALPAFRENPPDRCYHCKRHLLRLFLEEARRLGAEVLWEGTHQDDLSASRPGLKALSELGVRSPLAEAGLNKKAVQALARKMGLPQAEKLPSPCLATRFPPGEPVTREGLYLVYRAEEALRDLLGEETLRVRYVRGEARLEVPPEALPRVFSQRWRIVTLLRKWGFRRISLDLEGYSSSRPPEKA